jgi:hypothetical protein
MKTILRLLLVLVTGMSHARLLKKEKGITYSSRIYSKWRNRYKMPLQILE